jgi:hypothetical protein
MWLKRKAAEPTQEKPYKGKYYSWYAPVKDMTSYFVFSGKPGKETLRVSKIVSVEDKGNDVYEIETLNSRYSIKVLPEEPLIEGK